MSDGGRDRALRGVEVWKSSQKWSAQRSVVRSIAWLGLWWLLLSPLDLVSDRKRCGGGNHPLCLLVEEDVRKIGITQQDDIVMRKEVQASFFGRRTRITCSSVIPGRNC
jgi:hypothetical protein